MATITIQVKSLSQRIFLIIIALACLLFVIFSVKWFFGNAISNGVDQKQVADFAVTLGPSDPETHFALALIDERSFLPEDMPKSLAEYEKAVALSPNDYLLWLAYGKARERNGDPDGAEKALEKAIELAPNYAELHWVYGNILLRRDKNKEAFAEIQKAVEANGKYAKFATSIAWDIFEGDVEKIKSVIGNSIAVQSALAVTLAEQRRFDKAIEIWNGLPEISKKKQFLDDSKRILSILTSNKKYRSAFQVKSQIDEESEKMSIGKVNNGGFEEPVDASGTEIFDWQIAKGKEPKIGVDIDQQYKGEKSLALVFNSPVGKKFRNISQTIVVEGDKNYQFEVFYKSDLETKATVRWEVVNVLDGEVLVTTQDIEPKSDWKSLNGSFKTSSETEGVIIRLVRANCTSADCSISGTVWFDDVSLN